MCALAAHTLKVHNLVTWKDSFDRLNTELELTKRKKQALDDLHGAGRISQFVFECLNKGLTEDIEEIEARRKTLAVKMTRKLNELEEQRIALEMFLANTEMAYAAGEINGEIYAKEGSALDLGLEATKTELNWIKEVVVQLIPKESEPTASTPQLSTEAEVTPAEAGVEKTTEAASSMPVEVPVAVTATTAEVAVEQVQVPAETPAVTAPTPSEEEKKEGPA